MIALQDLIDEFKRELQQSREKGDKEPLANSGEKKQKKSSSDEDKPAAPVAAGKPKPACKYGTGCTRKNPVHFVEYTHPK